MSDFFVGGSAVLSITFSDPQQPGAATDPTVDPETGYKMVLPTLVTCALRKPDGTEVALAVTPPATGYKYTAKTPVFDRAGDWSFGWTAAGNYVDYKPGVIPVKAART